MVGSDVQGPAHRRGQKRAYRDYRSGISTQALTASPYSRAGSYLACEAPGGRRIQLGEPGALDQLLLNDSALFIHEQLEPWSSHGAHLRGRHGGLEGHGWRRDLQRRAEI